MVNPTTAKNANSIVSLLYNYNIFNLKNNTLTNNIFLLINELYILYFYRSLP